MILLHLVYLAGEVREAVHAEEMGVAVRREIRAELLAVDWRHVVARH